MPVLITGATGFLGTHLLKYIYLCNKDEIYVLSRKPANETKFIIQKNLSTSGLQEKDVTALLESITILEGDITITGLGIESRLSHTVAQSVSAIWHCAGAILLEEDPEKLFMTNVLGTENILKFAQINKHIDIYYISTAYSSGIDINIVQEEIYYSSRVFTNSYEQSKHAAEVVLFDWASEFKRKAIIFRPSVLVSDLGFESIGIFHPLTQVSLSWNIVSRIYKRNQLSANRSDRIRVPCCENATLNLIPVDVAAKVMVELTMNWNSNDLDFVNVTYPYAVSITNLINILAEYTESPFYPLYSKSLDKPTAVEKKLMNVAKAFVPYHFQNKVFINNTLLRNSTIYSGLSELSSQYIKSSFYHRPDQE
jgi:thioester reductase-like protein